jgi:hypothetical protein
MSNTWRIILMVVVWIALGSIAASAIGAAHLSGNIDANAITIIAMVMATVSTIAIWLGPEWVTARRGGSQTHYISGEWEKAKRGANNLPEDSRLALLLELMDEDERQAFKERLQRQVLDEAYLTDDGEIAYRGQSLKTLLEDEAEQHQRLRK